MARARKINLEKVRASLDSVCPKCGRVIPPAEVRRVDFERIECPACGARFVPCLDCPRAKRSHVAPSDVEARAFGMLVASFGCLSVKTRTSLAPGISRPSGARLPRKLVESASYGLHNNR
jgi:ribosomal protein S27AE